MFDSCFLVLFSAAAPSVNMNFLVFTESVVSQKVLLIKVWLLDEGQTDDDDDDDVC